MKKILSLFIIILLLFIGFNNSALAFVKTKKNVITNNIQKEYEAKFKTEFGQEIIDAFHLYFLLNGEFLIKEDY